MATIKDRYIIEVDTADASSGIDRLKGGLGSLVGSLKGMGPLIAGAAAAFSAFAGVSAIQDRINDFDELAKRARAVGVANEESFKSFQVLSGFLAEAGIAAGETDAILRKLQTAVAENEDGTKNFVAIFDKLGDAAKDANGDILPIPDLFNAVASAVQDGTLSMADATDLFGKGAGGNLVNLFNEMAESGTSLGDALEDVAQHTNIVDINAAKNAEAFNDNIGRLKEGMSQLLTDAITPLLPILLELSEKILAELPGIIQSVQNAFETLSPVFNLIGTVLTDLVFPILTKVFEVLGKLAPIIQPIAETALPILSAAFEGIVAIIERVVSTIVGLVDKLKSFGETAKELKNSVTGAFGDMADNMSNKARAASEGVTGWFGKMYDDLWGNSIIPDLVKGVSSGFEEMASNIEGETESAVSNIKNGFSSIFGTVAGGLGNAIRIGSNEARNVLGNFGSTFKNIVGNIVSEGQSASGSLGDALNVEGISDDLLNNVNLSLTDFENNIKLLEMPMASYRDNTEQINLLLQDTNSTYNTLLESLTEFIEVNDQLNDQNTTTLEQQSQLIESFNEYSELINTVIEDIVKQTESIDLLTESNVSLDETYQQVNESAAQLVDTIIESVEQLDLSTESSNLLGDSFSNLSDTVGSYIERLKEKISSTNSAISANENLAKSFENIAAAATNAATAQSRVNRNQSSSSPLSTFAGFFANGGFIPRGQYGVVGEAGPELVNGPASVTPLSSMGTTVNYNINAVDAISFRQLVASDPEFIHAVAYRGGLNVPGSRR